MPPQTQASPAMRFLMRLIAVLFALVVIVYCVDFTWYHIRIAVPSLGSPTSSVHRIRVLAIPDKGNKTEYQIDALHPQEDVPCARSLFPHSDLQPCWYVSRRAKQPIAM
ncbi:MAG TPA: hypothetical protein VL128_09420 [Candidatus Eisenbacteria bacterium]|nr:hypothetical protein [Candidatus Eisenbacteria bacterium]